MNKPTTLLVLLMAALAGSTAHAKDYIPFSVVVIEDAAEGDTLMQRDADAAIDKLTANTARLARFPEHNNLCVAYIVAKDAAAAREACERAVTTGERRARDAGTWRGPAFRRDYAISLTNRGVLHALTGHAELAAADFKAAHRLYRRLKEPQANLDRLADRAAAAATAVAAR